ncbi:MAG: nucleoid-associated protein [Schleiferiaceae bacterium]|nr:nucleoid-associated protein [Schleiferiaceae bacterium]
MMIDVTHARILDIAVHKIGERELDEPLLLADSSPDFDEENRFWMLEMLAKAFENAHEKYTFTHDNDLSFNVVHNYSRKYFSDEVAFFPLTKELATHLYKQSDHPKIKGGDFLVVAIDELTYLDQRGPALVLLKVENKADFIDHQFDTSHPQLHKKSGIDMRKIDKAALIFEMGLNDGELEVLLIDRANRGEEAQFWKSDFLGVSPKATEYRHTTQFLQTAKDYIKDQFQEDFDADRVDTIDLLNRSVSYFQNNQVFEQETFEDAVFQDQRLKDAFRVYTKQVEAEIGSPILPEEGSFTISEAAVKKQARVFKSIIKLDKNFHIYIHGKREWVEKGIDPDTGKKFYKLFYDEET